MEVERNPCAAVPGSQHPDGKHPASGTQVQANPQEHPHGLDGNPQENVDHPLHALSTKLPPLNRHRPPPLASALLEHSHDRPQDPHYLRMYLRGCSHDLVAIKYCASENDVCHRCHKRPIRGWLYRCAGDSYDAECDSVDDPFLSPSITKAIADGHYSEEQIEGLHLQKLEVREDAEALRDEPPSTPSRNSSDDLGHHTDDSNHPQEGAMEDIDTTELPRPSVRTVDMEKRKPRRASCDFQACYRCHWRYGASAIISLDQVCSDPKVKAPSLDDLAGAPVSDPNIVSNMLVKRPAYTMFRDDNGRYYYQEIRKMERGPIKKLSLAELWQLDRRCALEYQHTLGQEKLMEESCPREVVPGACDDPGLDCMADSETEEGEIRDDWRREYRDREDSRRERSDLY